MDNGLVHDKKNIGSKGTKNRLNPCCSGQWSRTEIEDYNENLFDVLILVVVDNGLVQFTE